MSEQIYTKETFAAHVGISVRTLERLMKKGKVMPVRFGTRVIFREHHVTQLLDNCDTSLQKALKR